MGNSQRNGGNIHQRVPHSGMGKKNPGSLSFICGRFKYSLDCGGSSGGKLCEIRVTEVAIPIWADSRWSCEWVIRSSCGIWRVKLGILGRLSRLVTFPDWAGFHSRVFFSRGFTRNNNVNDPVYLFTGILRDLPEQNHARNCGLFKPLSWLVCFFMKCIGIRWCCDK